MDRDDDLRVMERMVISDMLRKLDTSLEQNSLEEALLLVDRWNLYQRKQSDPLGGIADSMGLEFIAEVVRDKGLRLPSLAEAMKVGRVTISGDVRFGRNFLKALTGQAPLKVDNCSLTLKVAF